MYEGTSLRIDRPDWFTMEGYVQAGYPGDMPARFWLRDNNSGKDSAESSGKLKRDQPRRRRTARGPCYRVDAISDRLVFFPYAVVAADWLWNRNRVSGLNIDGQDSYDLLGNGKSCPWARAPASTCATGSAKTTTTRHGPI